MKVNLRIKWLNRNVLWGASQDRAYALKPTPLSYISGYEDGGDQPDKILNLMPKAHERARTFLLNHPDTREKLERVIDLVDGFESPSGLELLTTVHWVFKKDNARSEQEIVNGVHSWSDRKKRFSSRQVGIALETLKNKHWI